MVTTEFNLIKLKNELLNKLRVNLNSYDSKHRIKEVTKTFTGDGDTTIFELDSQLLSYVSTVTVNSVEKTFVTDWDILWRGDNKGSIEFVAAPGDGLSISIECGIKQKKGNFIYPDFPRTDLTESSYPRIGFKTWVNSSTAGLGGGSSIPYVHELLVQIKIVSLDTYELDYLLNEIKDYLIKNSKNFYYFNWIDLESMSEYDNYPDNSNKTLTKFLQFKIPFKYEIVTYS